MAQIGAVEGSEAYYAPSNRVERREKPEKGLFFDFGFNWDATSRCATY